MGILKNYVWAYMWYNLAIYNGSSSGIKYKEKITQEMTPTQIKKAQEMYAECLQSGYKDVSMIASFDMGMSAAQSSDYLMALSVWVPLAQQGYASAQYNLGHIYARGYGIPADNKSAMQWYTKAAKLGYVEAQVELGNINSINNSFGEKFYY